MKKYYLSALSFLFTAIVAEAQVGIGTTTPSAQLHVVGQTGVLHPLRLEGLTPGSETNLLVLDASGNLTMNAPLGISAGLWTRSGSMTYLTNTSDFVGIGTSAPNQQLELTGNFRLPVTTPTAGIVYYGADRFLHIYGTGNQFTGIQAGNFTLTGQQNTGTGYQALTSLIGGRNNSAYGSRALYNNTDAWGNSAFGNQALYSNTVGWYNCAFGDRALFSNQNGQYNTGIGYQALYYNVLGTYNTAIGYQALYRNTGGQNTGIGFKALSENTSGAGNNAVGYTALGQNTTGLDNNAYGRQAMAQNSTGSYNVAVGAEGLQSNSTGQFNIAMGYRALLSNSSGYSNTVIGTTAGMNNTTGSRNLIAGDSAGYYNISGSKNIFLGYQAGLNETASERLYIENSDASPANSLIYGEFDNDILATNGKLGVGTTSPTTKLHVIGQSGVLDPLRLEGLQTGTSADFLVTDANGVVTKRSDLSGYKFGDATNYATFESDGTLVFYGNATVYNDFVVPLTTARPGATGNNPQWAQFRNNGSGSRGVFAFQFEDVSNAGNEQEIFVTVQMPHDWKEGSAVNPHLHWSPMDNASGVVRWGLEYTWVNYDPVTMQYYPTTTIAYANSGSLSNNQYGSVITGFGSITPSTSQDKISSVLVIRIFRNSSNAADTYTGNAAGLSFDLHYETNTLGSRSEFSK